MAIISNVELWWVKLDPKRPTYFKNDKKTPGKWQVQIRTEDDDEAERWSEEYGLSVKMDKDKETKKVFYKASLSTYAFDKKGEPNEPVVCILKNGVSIDPNTVGNGSIGNVRFWVSDDKEVRRLNGVQIVKWVKYEPKDQEEFDLGDDFEVIGDDDLDDEIVY